MSKKSKIIVLIAAVLCGVIFIVFTSLGIAEICNNNPMGKTYKASVIKEDDEEKKVTAYYKITFSGRNYEYENYEITFFTAGGKEVNEIENASSEYEISDDVVTLSSFPQADNGFLIEGHDLVWGEVRLTRSGYWLLGIYWGGGGLTLFAGLSAFCFYKYYVYKKAGKVRQITSPEN